MVDLNQAFLQLFGGFLTETLLLSTGRMAGLGKSSGGVEHHLLLSKELCLSLCLCLPSPVGKGMWGAGGRGGPHAN